MKAKGAFKAPFATDVMDDPHQLDNQAATSSRPRLAHGITLLGEFQGSGLSVPGYLVRRPDGTMLLLSRIPFALAEQIDGEKNLVDLAEALSDKLGRRIQADGVAYLIEKKLIPVGVIDDGSPERREPKAILDLAGRAAVVPPMIVRSVAKRLEFLFRLPVVALVLLCSAATVTWIFVGAGLGADPGDLLAQPKSVLLLLSLTLLSALWHELGHASASSFGRADPGAIGVGIYVVWPVLYTDTTESYRLSRAGRVRTDVGGMYFNLILISAFGLAYAWSNQGLWAAAAMVQLVLIVYQFLPFIRLDGYYLMTDITGIPDLFAYMRPALRSLVPGTAAGQRVQNLKPGVRLVVTVWALSAALALAWFVIRFVLRAPELAQTVWAQVGGLWGDMTSAVSAGHLLDGAATVLVLALIAIQVFGLLVVCGRVIGRSCGGSCTSGRARNPHLFPSWSAVISTLMGLTALKGKYSNCRMIGRHSDRERRYVHKRAGEAGGR